MVKKFRRYLYLFWHNPRTWQTHTDTAWRHRQRLCIASGGKKTNHNIDELKQRLIHWLDIPEPVQYKLGVTVRRYQQHNAPQYLIDCVTSASDIASRQRLRSASRHQLLVLRYQLSSLGRRSFAVAGPTTWNSLSADLRNPTCSDESFRRSLKTSLFAKY